MNSCTTDLSQNPLCDLKADFSPVTPKLSLLTPTTSSRINAARIPRPEFSGPCEVVYQKGGKLYDANKSTLPPSAASVYTVHDHGSATCRFVRLTLNQVPTRAEALASSKIPFVAITQPFALRGSMEDPVPLLKNDEPERCARCRSYINPFTTWASRGLECNCNFCESSYKLSEKYADSVGYQVNESEHPELWRGTVDHPAPRHYAPNSRVASPAFCFLIDVSTVSHSTGLMQTVARVIDELLISFPSENSTLAIGTFSDAVCFYALNPLATSTSHQVLVMPDLSDPFVPAPPSSLLFSPHSDYHRIRSLLMSLSTTPPGNSTTTSSAYQAAIKVATTLLGERGGGLILLLSASSITLDKSLKQQDRDIFVRYRRALSGWLNEIKSLNENGVGFDIFDFGGNNSAATPVYAALSFHTGGSLRHASGFDYARDGEKLKADLKSCLTRNQGFKCTVKIRCSKGLNLEKMYCNVPSKLWLDQSSFRVARITCDTAFAIQFKLEEKIESSKHVYIQVAVLHATMDGELRVRVFTVALSSASSMNTFFRSAEVEATMNYFCRIAAHDIVNGEIPREKLVQLLIDLLMAYRVNCAAQSSAGQLILPDSLKYLPLYMSSFLKNSALALGSYFSDEERLCSIMSFTSMAVAKSTDLIYPRVYQLHRSYSKSNGNGAEKVGCPTGVEENVYLPERVPTSGENIVSDGVYLCDTGSSLLIYIGADVVPSYVEELCCVSHPDIYNCRELQICSPKVMAILNQIRRERTYETFLPIKVISAMSVPDEARFRAYLVEDRLGTEPAYVDFLCLIHRMINMKMDE